MTGDRRDSETEDSAAGVELEESGEEERVVEEAKSFTESEGSGETVGVGEIEVIATRGVTEREL